MAIGTRINPVIYVFCLLSTWGWSIELQPWVGNYLEFEWRTTPLYQSYHRVASHSQLVDYASDDFFLTTSLSNTLAAELAVEVEVTAAHTRRQRWDVDNFRLALRYMWLDDLLGDRISLTTGAILTQSFANSLPDISSFHHGRSEAELFVSVGRENSGEETWISRWWGVGGIGFAERGSPWLRGNIAYEYRFAPVQEVRLFVNSLWGLGHKRLRIHDFHGYGSLQHQSVDVGIRYTHLIRYFGSVALEYSNRRYARNFPAQVHCVLFTFLFTFSL